MKPGDLVWWQGNQAVYNGCIIGGAMHEIITAHGYALCSLRELIIRFARPRLHKFTKPRIVVPDVQCEACGRWAVTLTEVYERLLRGDVEYLSKRKIAVCDDCYRDSNFVPEDDYGF